MKSPRRGQSIRTLIITRIRKTKNCGFFFTGIQRKKRATPQRVIKGVIDDFYHREKKKKTLKRGGFEGGGGARTKKKEGIYSSRDEKLRGSIWSLASWLISSRSHEKGHGSMIPPPRLFFFPSLLWSSAFSMIFRPLNDGSFFDDSPPPHPVSPFLRYGYGNH